MLKCFPEGTAPRPPFGMGQVNKLQWRPITQLLRPYDHLSNLNTINRRSALPGSHLGFFCCLGGAPSTGAQATARVLVPFAATFRQQIIKNNLWYSLRFVVILLEEGTRGRDGTYLARTRAHLRSSAHCI